MMTDAAHDLLTAALQLGGAFLFLASAIAVWRLPDLASRIHGPTKAASLGIALLAGALALHRLELTWFLESALLVFFVFLTVPLSAQVLLRSSTECPRSHTASSKAQSPERASLPPAESGPGPDGNDSAPQ